MGRGWVQRDNAEAVATAEPIIVAADTSTDVGGDAGEVFSSGLHRDDARRW
jgi:hypothetical protein